jgi:hypothetical protein
MNSDNLILRETDNLPLINKDDTLTNAEIDGNFINIYNDFVALSQANDPTLMYDVDRSYSIGEFATYDGRMWVSIEASTGVTPIIGSADWNDVFPTVLAHEKNKDTILDEGGTNETTVAEIRAFIDAGLTSTTNLSLSTKTGTSFKIESSTGSDVTIPQATNIEAGLLNAEDKVKLDNTSGINTGDQTLISLNAEDVDNKVTDFTTINDTLYPTTQAVDTYITAVVPDLVDTFIGGLVAQDLQDVTTVGNTTTDNIEFTGGVGVLFDNTSTLRKGTIDAGYGGAKGIAQICSVGYELKWEAGRLYVMGDGGTTIREVSHNFTTTPGATDDNTKGFIVGSRWILDDGSLYICSDVTTATAVWTLQSIDAVPTDGSNKAVESNGVFDALALKVDTVVGSRLITSAESTLLGNTSGTNTGDQTISDATITTTDITTNNFTTAKHGFVPKGTNVGNYLKDDGTWGTPASGSSGGIWGIANSSGVYTYYATYQLAVAAAVAGQTIEMFGSQTESIADHILKNGVNINYNGYILTFASGFRMIDNSVACEVQLLNGEIKKGVSTQIAIYITNSSTILRGNALINSSLAGAGGTGSYGYVGRGKIYGLNFKGNDCVTLSISGDNLGEAYGITVNCTSGFAVSSGTVLMNSTINSTGTSSTISGTTLISSCAIRSNGASSITSANRVVNCSIVNLTSSIISGDPNLTSVENCYLDARASFVYNFGAGVADPTSSVLIDCTLRSGTQYVNGYGSVGNLINCTVTAEASVCVANAYGIYNGTKFYSKLNTTSGHCVTYPNTGNKYIGCHFETRNASAVALWSDGTPTVYATNSTIARTTTFKSAGIVNGQTNTADAQGNVILQ